MKTNKTTDSYDSKSDSRKRQYDIAYMDIAKRWAELSLCDKKKVGAIIVKDGMIISDGFNGTPSGFDNQCEDEQSHTHWYTLHAEANAILKITKSTQSSSGATLYITCCPCRDCSKLIYQSGIKRVIYGEDYKTVDGINFLKEAGIQVQTLRDLKNNLTDILDVFQLEYNDKQKHTASFYQLISKVEKEKDYDSINKSIDTLLQKYSDDIELLQCFLVTTNICKEKLSERHRVYAKLIQKVGMSEFVRNLK